MDEQTKAPIDYASVYFDGTFVGCTTDEEGRFELDVTEYKSRSLTISAVGYHSGVLSEFTPGKTHQLCLTPRVFEIKEVSVSTRSLARKRRACMRIFVNEFIGLTSNARKCHILNEEDITFNYGFDKDTLQAYAFKPIRILNLALGYEITYHLDRFEYDRHTKTVLYTGNIIFNNDLAFDKESQTKFDRRRTYAYTGSCKHFFRSLWNNTLKPSGFIVSSYRTGEPLLFENIVYQDIEGRKFLRYKEALKIDYYEILTYISFIEARTLFEEDGFFDPTSIIWTGEMSRQRIADFLPYEYLLPR